MRESCSVRSLEFLEFEDGGLAFEESGKETWRCTDGESSDGMAKRGMERKAGRMTVLAEYAAKESRGLCLNATEFCARA
jgi:hypothetical protein